MTWLEKFYMDNPCHLGASRSGVGCPADYVDDADCPQKPDGSTMSCSECWGRKIPEIPEEKEEKENKPMKKTKAMPEEELEQKKNEIEELKKELVKVEKYKQYDDMAGEIKAIYDSFVNAGFNRDQAYEILIILLQNQKAASNSWESYLSKYLSMCRK